MTTERISRNEPATAKAVQDWFNVLQYVAASTGRSQNELAAMLDESDIELEAALIAQGLLDEDEVVAKFRWSKPGRLYVVLDSAEVFSIGWDGSAKIEFKP